MKITLKPIDDTNREAVLKLTVREDQPFVAPNDVSLRQAKIVGLVTTVTAMAIGHPDGYTKINGLGVLPEYRNNGIGRMLLKRAERVAEENGTGYIALASGFRRDEAHAFYEHMGYQKTSYWFRKRL